MKHSFVILVFVAVVLAIAAPALAQSVVKNPLGQGATFSDILTRVINFALTLLPAVATIMIMVAAFLYMTAGGSEDRVKMAHRALIYAVIGIAIVLLAKGAELIVRDLLTPSSNAPMGTPGGTPPPPPPGAGYQDPPF